MVWMWKCKILVNNKSHTIPFSEEICLRKSGPRRKTKDFVFFEALMKKKKRVWL